MSSDHGLISSCPAITYDMLLFLSLSRMGMFLKKMPVSDPIPGIHRMDPATDSRVGDCFTAIPASPAPWFAMTINIRYVKGSGDIFTKIQACIIT